MAEGAGWGMPPAMPKLDDPMLIIWAKTFAPYSCIAPLKAGEELVLLQGGNGGQIDAEVVVAADHIDQAGPAPGPLDVEINHAVGDVAVHGGPAQAHGRHDNAVLYLNVGNPDGLEKLR